MTDLLLSSPDIMPTLIGLSGLGDKIPSSVQGENYADYLLTGNPSSPLPQSALYIRNLDGDKDENGKVTNYFPEIRGVKTADYTLALSIDRKSKSLKQTYFYHDAKDPYQLNNLSLTDYPEEAAFLLEQLAQLLEKVEDPWYEEKILQEIVPYN